MDLKSSRTFWKYLESVSRACNSKNSCMRSRPSNDAFCATGDLIVQFILLILKHPVLQEPRPRATAGGDRAILNAHKSPGLHGNPVEP